MRADGMASGGAHPDKKLSMKSTALLRRVRQILPDERDGLVPIVGAKMGVGRERQKRLQPFVADQMNAEHVGRDFGG